MEKGIQAEKVKEGLQAIEPAPTVARGSQARAQSWGSLGFWLCLPLFAIAYTQAPFFSSNQHHYFLRGIAQSGEGYLTQDWLANTVDTSPLFTALIQVTESAFAGYSVLAYAFYYIVLSMVFLYASVGIAVRTWKMEQQSSAIWALALALTILLSYPFEMLSKTVIGMDIGYHLEEGVAKQYLLDGLLQPSTFGVFLLLSVYFTLSHKWAGAVLAGAFAAIVHPSYLLPAAVLTLFSMIQALRHTRSLSFTFWLGTLSLVLVLPVVLYNLSTFSATSESIKSEAYRILVTDRLAHHAMITTWLNKTVVIKVGLVCLALYLTRHRPVCLVLALGFGWAVVGTAAQYVTGSHFLALLFPWRISVALVPLASVLIIGAAIAWLERSRVWVPQAGQVLKTTAMVAMVTLLFSGTYFQLARLTAHEMDDVQGIIKHAKSIRSPGQLYVVPRQVEGLRLGAGVPVWADYKSLPYKDIDVITWNTRLKQSEALYRSTPENACDNLKQVLATTPVTHVILPAADSWQQCPGTELLYQDSYYMLVQDSSKSLGLVTAN
ncbi:DUF6798 domain-containing protein [Ferrimonas marina]|uniref:DUF6798 domain-containing protein n=1 Tax=Ferrimonas marina TaxID=299255 RepID=A0A1M5QXA4_9GAMM|nr:DUF6798 domain-containing protein [Ferrimonas marina]SHH18183.1 hypothetical protein SAMN02745129_1378 [Ferrimonas marina]